MTNFSHRSNPFKSYILVTDKRLTVHPETFFEIDTTSERVAESIVEANENWDKYCYDNREVFEDPNFFPLDIGHFIKKSCTKHGVETLWYPIYLLMCVASLAETIEWAKDVLRLVKEYKGTGS